MLSCSKIDKVFIIQLLFYFVKYENDIKDRFLVTNWSLIIYVQTYFYKFKKLYMTRWSLSLCEVKLPHCALKTKQLNFL